jgi:hypothetical protein
VALRGESLLNALRDAVNAIRDSMLDEKPSVRERCPEVTKDPNAESKAGGNKVDLVFDPDKSEKVTKCEKIVHVQFTRTYTDGKVIKRGDYSTSFKYHDKVTTDDGWSVDHLASEKTPDYQQGTGDGKKNGGSTKAKISDAPQSRGGDKGFYDPKANPTGWKEYRAEFVTFAYCMKGPDCGKWYEGTSWEYKKTWEDQRDGKTGESKITDKSVTTGPSKSYLDAFDRFNKEKGFTPCK